MVRQTNNHSIHFRYFKNNMQSIAVLMPLIPFADIVHEPCDGIMLYSFATQQAPDVFLEIERSKTHSIFIAFLQKKESMSCWTDTRHLTSTAFEAL